jgi:hypothetical protein
VLCGSGTLRRWHAPGPPNYGDNRSQFSIVPGSARPGRARIPPKGLVGTYKCLERPIPAEGFDELYCARVARGLRFEVRPWTAADATPPPRP